MQFFLKYFSGRGANNIEKILLSPGDPSHATFAEASVA